jgi:DeoR/GlpR family transcriptional regulator of sugar metabolism
MNTINDGNHLLSSDRRRKILDVVNERRSISVDELAALFPVSAITIRRDLDRLAEEGAVSRVHGGAMAVGGIVTAPRASAMSAKLTDDQLRIGREAARQIADGDFIIIESGSTCLALAQQLADKKRLKIVTASPRIAMTLADLTEKHDTDFEIVLSGGILHVYKNFCIGPHARTLFESVKVDIAFVSVTAIDLAAGVTADNVYEAEISRIILEQCSKRRVGLVTSQKFGKVSFVKVTDAEIFDEIITDARLDPVTTSRYTERGLRITAV